jgi:hypothetical protein
MDLKTEEHQKELTNDGDTTQSRRKRGASRNDAEAEDHKLRKRFNSLAGLQMIQKHMIDFPTITLRVFQGWNI